MILASLRSGRHGPLRHVQSPVNRGQPWIFPDKKGWGNGGRPAFSEDTPKLVGGLEHGLYEFPYIGNNHPTWLSHIFQRGGEKPPSRKTGDWSSQKDHQFTETIIGETNQEMQELYDGFMDFSDQPGWFFGDVHDFLGRCRGVDGCHRLKPRIIFWAISWAAEGFSCLTWLFEENFLGYSNYPQ